MLKNLVRCGVGAAILLAVVPCTQAAWTAIDDFENRNLDNLDGQGDWRDNLNSTTLWVVMEDPTGPAGNQVARFSGVAGGIELHPVSVPDGTTATLFYRMYLVDADSDSEYRIGVGEDFGEDPWGTTPWHQSWDSYETIVRNYVPLDGEDQTLAAITNPPAWASLDATIERQTWYSFWQVIDSVNNQFQVYIQGGDYATPTALTGPTGFRGGTESGDLTTFYVLTMGGGNEDFMYFDDLYLADGEDTSNPVGSAPLPGDLNGDGFVGGDDLDIVRGFWGQNVTPGDLLSGDPSGDGFVGGDDLDIVRGSWGQGTPPAAGAVPEPVALVFFATGMLSLLACGRRRRGTV